MFSRVLIFVIVVGIALIGLRVNAQDAPAAAAPAAPAGVAPTAEAPAAQEDTAGQSAVPGLQPKQVVPQETEQSLTKKASYLLGYNLASRMIDDLNTQGVTFDMAKLTEGIEKGLSGAEVGMTDEEIQSVMMAFRDQVERQQIEKMKKMADENKAEGVTFLAEFAKLDGVEALDKGVFYKIEEAGSGESPAIDQKVKIHYHGALPNGEVFDSSLKPLDGSPPEPVVYPVGGFVPGFSAALLKMKVGSKWRVAIPSDQAYGANGRGEIGPNQALLFDVQLLEIVK